jgi:hypothetical protein
VIRKLATKSITFLVYSEILAIHMVKRLIDFGAILSDIMLKLDVVLLMYDALRTSSDSSSRVV